MEVVDRGRPKPQKYLGLLFDFLMDLEAQTLTALKYFMLYRFIWISGADVIKHMDLLTEEGSKFDDFQSERIG